VGPRISVTSIYRAEGGREQRVKAGQSGPIVKLVRFGLLMLLGASRDARGHHHERWLYIGQSQLRDSSHVDARPGFCN
jgi:hypothetical protein